jgi:hypothetical protein
MRKPWGSVCPGVVTWLLVLAGAIAGCHGGAESRLPDAGGESRDAANDVATMPDRPADLTGAGGSPGTLKEVAAACGAGAECASGHCFDGVCCRSDCPGPCQSCKVDGTVGTCVNTPVGSDPRDDCPDEGVASCGGDGTCDGTGTCALYAAGTICRPQGCSGSTLTHASRCGGDGECAAAVSDSCGQYTCNASGTCRSSCASNADCVAGAACVNGSCGPKPPGAPCASAADCASGICAQGLCCATACTGTCKSCAIAGSEGQCINVPSGADPLDQCPEEAAMTCGNDGTCDGAGACRRHAGGTSCAPPSCADATATPGRTCNGSGTCLVVISTSCSPYACGAVACRTNCNSDAECAAPNVCIASVCGPRATGGTGGGAGTSGSAGIGGGGSGGAAGRGGSSGNGGAAGNAATAGTGGPAGTNGAAGTTGTGGVAGAAGAAGRGGTGASAGAGGGAAGTSGLGGTTGVAGTTAAAGTGGTAAGGTTGTAGRGGTGGGAGCPGYVFCDDFEDGNANGWAPSGGTWSVVTDGSRVYQGGNGNSMSLAGGTTWSNQTIQARMKVLQYGGTSTSYRAGIVARASNTTDLYVFAIDASGAMRLLKGTSSPAGDGASGTCGKVIVDAQVNTWYTLRMTIAGTGGNVRLTTYLDNTPIHDCQTSIGTLPSGGAGTYIYGPNTIAEFDDVRLSVP